MANFNECTTCGALTTPESAKFHAADHAHTDKRLDALTRLNRDYLQEIAALRGDIADYARQLSAHPISADPETITIEPAPDFDPDDLDNAYEDISPQAVADIAADDEPERPYPLAIDRDDDLDTRLANATGQINL